MEVEIVQPALHAVMVITVLMAMTTHVTHVQQRRITHGQLQQQAQPPQVIVHVMKQNLHQV